GRAGRGGGVPRLGRAAAAGGGPGAPRRTAGVDVPGRLAARRAGTAMSAVAGPPADRAAPSGRVERYRVGLSSLLSLLAGRASYRLVMLATSALLWPVWGRERFGTYAAALATFSWLTVLMLGPEKAMLKLLPRAPRTGPMVTAALVAVLWWLPLPVVAAFVVVRLFDGPGSAAVHVGVAGMQLSIGCTMVLVGLHRAAGRARVDTATLLTMSTAQLC